MRVFIFNIDFIYICLRAGSPIKKKIFVPEFEGFFIKMLQVNCFINRNQLIGIWDHQSMQNSILRRSCAGDSWNMSKIAKIIKSYRSSYFYNYSNSFNIHSYDTIRCAKCRKLQRLQVDISYYTLILCFDLSHFAPII